MERPYRFSPFEGMSGLLKPTVATDGPSIRKSEVPLKCIFCKAHSWYYVNGSPCCRQCTSLERIPEAPKCHRCKERDSTLRFNDKPICSRCADALRPGDPLEDL